MTISGPPNGNTFTYQGSLKQDGAVVNGVADFQFSLWNQETGGTQFGGLHSRTNVPVNDGLFTVVLNDAHHFGAGALDGSARWLQVVVRSPAGSGSYTTLSPRQALTPATMAWFAERATQADLAAEALEAATAFSLSAQGGPANAVTVDSAGRVGIGSATPLTRLDVRGSNGEPCVLIGQYFSRASVDLSNGAGHGAGMYVDQTGTGYVYANVKNFRVPNPLDPATDIVYACPEGPEAAMYIRGTARLQNGHAVITLPDHFCALAAEPGMTVQLTPRSGASRGLAATAISLSGIVVQELLDGTGTYDFDWRVEAVRREHQDYRVIRDWRERAPDIGAEQERWNARLEDIQRREQRVLMMEAALNAHR